MDEDVAALQRLCDMSAPWVVATAVGLRLPTLIDRGTTTTADLAEAAAVDAVGLEKTLRYLAAVGVVRGSGGHWELDRLGAYLSEDHPGGLWTRVHPDRAWARIMRSWAGLGHALRTGGPGYAAVTGRPFWDDLAAHPEIGRSFGETMEAFSDGWAAAFVAAVDWSGVRHLVDLGGGRGNLAAAVLSATVVPGATVVDQAGTAADARSLLAGRGVGDRAAFAAGDLFDACPAHGDVVVLAHVLHDWPDDAALAILRRAVAAVEPGGRLLLVELVLGSPELVEDPGPGAASDLLMFLLFGAGERTEAQWRALLAAAGWEIAALRPLGRGRYVLECEAATPHV